MKIIWLDVETTGVDYKTDTIIELAALYEDGKKKSKFHMYCKPKVKPENFDFISDLTGITWEFLEEKGKTEKQLYQFFFEWLNTFIKRYDKKDKAIFAAYNAKFDNNFIRELFKRNNDKYFGSWFHAGALDILSTVLMAIRLGKLEKPENLKNETIAKALNIPLDGAHSAIEDIKASRLVQIELERRIQGK